MLSTLLELVGFALLVTFGFLVWPPVALAIAGVGLMVAAQAVRR